jgi:hypothetical protein
MKKLSREFWYVTIIVIFMTIFSVLSDITVLNITSDYFEHPQEIIITVREGE